MPPVGGREGAVIKLGEIVMILYYIVRVSLPSAIARQLGIDRKTVRKDIASVQGKFLSLGAICPAGSTGVAPALPRFDTGMMQLVIEEISPHVADCTAGAELLARMSNCDIFYGDKGRDSNALRRQIENAGAMPNIPPKANRRWKNCFSSFLYRNRNAIERHVLPTERLQACRHTLRTERRKFPRRSLHPLCQQLYGSGPSTTLADFP
jgi:hypothetical protein